MYAESVKYSLAMFLEQVSSRRDANNHVECDFEAHRGRTGRFIIDRASHHAERVERANVAYSHPQSRINNNQPIWLFQV
jgi:hypothetical protein